MDQRGGHEARPDDLGLDRAVGRRLHPLDLEGAFRRRQRELWRHQLHAGKHRLLRPPGHRLHVLHVVGVLSGLELRLWRHQRDAGDDDLLPAEGGRRHVFDVVVVRRGPHLRFRRHQRNAGERDLLRAPLRRHHVLGHEVVRADAFREHRHRHLLPLPLRLRRCRPGLPEQRPSAGGRRHGDARHEGGSGGQRPGRARGGAPPPRRHAAACSTVLPLPPSPSCRRGFFGVLTPRLKPRLARRGGWRGDSGRGRGRWRSSGGAHAISPPFLPVESQPFPRPALHRARPGVPGDRHFRQKLQKSTCPCEP